MYHTDQNHFAGQYLVHGGKGYAQRGGAGTMFREDTFAPTVHRELVVDNGGHEVRTNTFTAIDTLRDNILFMEAKAMHREEEQALSLEKTHFLLLFIENLLWTMEGMR